MKLKKIILDIIEEEKEQGNSLKGASEYEIIELKRAFKYKYDFEIPEAYLDILRITNGLKYNGLIIWPTAPYAEFNEGLFEANYYYRSTMRGYYFYFCMLDNDIYVYNTITDKYMLIDLQGHCTCGIFSSCKELLESALTSAWDSCEH